MNITDIDDKIIKRARQNYLYEKYVKDNHTFSNTLNDVKQVASNLENTIKTINDQDKKCMLEQMLYKITNAIGNLEKAVTDNDEKKIADLQKVNRLFNFILKKYTSFLDYFL